jgi:HEPN domain-containing protein
MDRKDLQTLSRVRVREARALAGAGLSDGAYYLAGYAVECALKACIAKATRRHEFPDKSRANASYTHDLPGLAKLAGLEAALRDLIARDGEFKRNWGIVKSWSEESRYRAHGPEVAQAMVKAIADRRHGVIPWIKRYW